VIRTIPTGDAPAAIADNAGTRSMTFTATLPQAPAFAVAFDVATADGTALAGDGVGIGTITGDDAAPCRHLGRRPPPRDEGTRRPAVYSWRARRKTFHAGEPVSGSATRIHFLQTAGTCAGIGKRA
jgi:hypothetical protein